MKLSTVGLDQQAQEGILLYVACPSLDLFSFATEVIFSVNLALGEEKRCLNSELWHACAGPLVCLPTVGTRVVYFPQGHSEQVKERNLLQSLFEIGNY